jgi:hypothetical protein
LSEHTDKPQLEDEPMTRVIETETHEEEETWIEDESGEGGTDEGDRGGGWDDDGEEALPRRPRGRLLRPLPLMLLAILVAAAGFLGGVEAQKGSEGSGSAAGPTGGATGTPSFGATSAAATGTVTSVEGHTIYVKESDGTVVAVKTEDGITVTRDSSVAAKKIHPGDTVVVEGSKSGSTVKASSIAATESGVESTSRPGAPATTTGSAEGGGSESEASVESLFEE